MIETLGVSCDDYGILTEHIELTCDMCTKTRQVVDARADASVEEIEALVPDWNFSYYDGWWCVCPTCLPD